MAIETCMGVDVDRFMETLPQVGDTFLELVKNALEAEGCTTVRVTLILDGEEPKLVVENDGVSFKSVEEVQKYLLTVFTTGKDANLSWGKGFTTVLKELRTLVESGYLTINIISHKKVLIDKSSTNVCGTRVTVYLKPDSDLKKRDIMSHHYILNNFVTAKKIYFNNEVVDTCTYDETKVTKLEKGLAIGTRGAFMFRNIPSMSNYFLMPDGGYAPIDIKGMEKAGLNIIVSDIKHMDTERVALNFHAEWTIKAWIEQYERNNAPDLSDKQGIIEWTENAFSWVMQLASKFSAKKMDMNFFGMKTRDVAVLAKLIAKLSTVADRIGIDDFNIPLPDKDTTRIVASYKAVIYDCEIREFILAHFGVEGIELFAKLVIGVMIAEGSVDGSAMLQDLVLVNYRVADIADKSTWIPAHMNLAPYIATYMELGFLVETNDVNFPNETRDKQGGLVTEQPDPKKVIANTEPPKIDLKAEDMTPEDAKEQFDDLVEKAKIAAREQNITEKDEEIAEQYEELADDEDPDIIPDWRYVEYQGVPCLVNKSVKNMDNIQFTVDVQAKKWKSWMNVCKLVGAYTGDMFTTGFVPVIMVTDGIMKEVVAMKDGMYVCLNRINTKIPRGSALRAGLWMTILAIHEFVHFKRTVHDKTFSALEEDTFMALLQDERYLQDLKKVVEVF